LRFARLHGVHHLLRHGESRAQAYADTSGAAFIRRGDRHRLRHLELRVAAHIADHVHADALVEALLEALGDKEEKVREMAIGALSRLGEAGAIPELVGLLGDKAGSVREAAADALRWFGPAAIPDLMAQVSQGAGQSRARPESVNAAKVLGAVGDDRASVSTRGGS
jgi:HEAT repeat protein